MLRSNGSYRLSPEYQIVDNTPTVYTYIPYSRQSSQHQYKMAPILENPNSIKIQQPQLDYYTKNSYFVSAPLPQVKYKNSSSISTNNSVNSLATKRIEPKPEIESKVEEYMKQIKSYRFYLNQNSNEKFKQLLQKPYSYYMNDSVFKSVRSGHQDETESSLNDYSYDSDDNTETFKRYAPTDDDEDYYYM